MCIHSMRDSSTKDHAVGLICNLLNQHPYRKNPEVKSKDGTFSQKTSEKTRKKDQRIQMIEMKDHDGFICDPLNQSSLKESLGRIRTKMRHLFTIVSMFAPFVSWSNFVLYVAMRHELRKNSNCFSLAPSPTPPTYTSRANSHTL